MFTTAVARAIAGTIISVVTGKVDAMDAGGMRTGAVTGAIMNVGSGAMATAANGAIEIAAIGGEMIAGRNVGTIGETIAEAVTGLRSASALETMIATIAVSGAANPADR